MTIRSARPQADPRGVVTVDLSTLPAGTYDLYVRPRGALSQERSRVALSPTTSQTLVFRPFTEGDADGDDAIGPIDLALLIASFGRAIGQPGFDPRVDFDHDGLITLSDLSLLASGYGTRGPLEVP